MKRKIRVWRRKLLKLPVLHLIIIVYTVVFASYFSVLAYTVYSAPKFTVDVEHAHIKRADIAYYTRGEGDPIILIPGFGMTMQHWDPELLRELSKGHKIIVYDYRGVGQSTGDVQGMTQHQMAEDVIELMDALKIEKADILGWSLGSFVAQNIAEDYPHKVNKLILVSTTPGGKEIYPAPKRIQDSVQQNIAANWEEFYVPMMFEDQDQKDEYLDELKLAKQSNEVPHGLGESLNAKIAQQLAFADQTAENKRYNNLKNISAPTLLITGERDEFTDVRNAKKVHNLIKNSQLHIIPNSGHAVLFESTEEVSELIKNFLN